MALLMIFDLPDLLSAFTRSKHGQAADHTIIYTVVAKGGHVSFDLRPQALHGVDIVGGMMALIDRR